MFPSIAVAIHSDNGFDLFVASILMVPTPLTGVDTFAFDFKRMFLFRTEFLYNHNFCAVFRADQINTSFWFSFHCFPFVGRKNRHAVIVLSRSDETRL